MFNFRSLDAVTQATKTTLGYSHIVKPLPEKVNPHQAPVLDQWDEALESIENDPESFAYCTPELQDDMHLAYIAVKALPENLKWASENLRNHGLFVSNAAANDIRVLEFAGRQLLSNEEFVLNMVPKNPQVLLYCHIDLLADPFFLDELQSANANIDNWINLRKNAEANKR